MSRTILLADDSVTIQKVIELTFMDEDYEVVAVGNGDDALEKLDEITPDFVIADVHMPGADGYDVAKQSKSLRPEVPVLLLVSTFEPFDEDKARKSGCDAFLKKPFDSQELQQLVERLSAEAAGEVTAEEAPSWQPEAPEEPSVSDESAEAEASPRPAEPFSIGLDDEDEAPPSRVSPPDEASAERRPAGFGEAGGATEAEPEVFELEPE
ncbi:MAG: response regulator, partial [Acidobacteriota bacterium]